MSKQHTITEEEMIEEARSLLEPGEERDNPEYLRGMCNLIASCFGRDGMPTDERSEEIEKQLVKGAG